MKASSLARVLALCLVACGTSEAPSPRSTGPEGTISPMPSASAGTAFGPAHTPTLVDVPPPTEALTRPFAAPFWTQHGDNARTGAVLDEWLLSPDAVASGAFGLRFSRKVVGQIYAQPLFVPNLDGLPGGLTADVVFVATEHDMVYAFDATAPLAEGPLWSVSLGTPMSSHDLDAEENDGNPAGPGYRDLRPEIGITSTPVIDLVAKTIYVVAKTVEPDGSYANRLHALSITDGSERAGSPVVIAPTSGADSMYAFHALQRSALTLDRGVVYVAFAGHGDIPPYHGWVVAYDAKSLAELGAYDDSPGDDGGGIWQAGQGLTVDESGDVYLAVGNGPYDPSTSPPSLGDSLVRLHLGPAGLAPVDWFTPYNALELQSADYDLGSAGVLAVPGTDWLVGGGKTGLMYVVDRKNMGKQGATSDAQIVQTFQGVLDAPIPQLFGAPVFWADDAGGKHMYLWGEGSTLNAFALGPSGFDPTPESRSEMLSAGQPGGILTVSADGARRGSGIVWAITPRADNGGGAYLVGGTLRAFDASDLSNELWSSDDLPSDAMGSLVKFCPPTVAGGRVFVATSDGALRVYGLAK